MTTDNPTFTVIFNSLKPMWALDSDSGDYPSGAGSCPRRPSWFIEDFTGSLVVECSDPSLDLFSNEWHDYLADLDAAPDADVKSWTASRVTHVGDRVRIEWVPQEWDEQDRRQDVD